MKKRTSPERWLWRWVRRWVEHRKEAATKRNCASGAHRWCCANETNSMMSPMFEMEGMPLVCPDCKAEATAHWKPGEGLTRIVLSSPNKD